MSLTQKLNSKSNIKQYSRADLPTSIRAATLNRNASKSTAAQTVINLGFSIDTLNNPDALLLTVDGKTLTLGALNDYTFSSVDAFGMSSQVTLNTPISAGLNIQAIKLGLKKETEFGVDARFIQLYEAESNGFQGFVKTNTLMNATTATGTPAAGTFHSLIVNRSPMVDLSQDLRPNVGVDRFMVERIAPILTEFAANGELVQAPINDTRNRIRFVGSWTNDNGGNAGPSVVTGVNTTDFMEVTFYGTGLNMLFSGNGLAYDFRASIDGGAEGANLQPGTISSVISLRGVAANHILPVASNLSLGVHTIRIRGNLAGNSYRVNGFEMLNESNLVRVNPGASYYEGKKYTSNAQTSFAYNADATGVRGGRVVVYQNADGTIGRAWTAVNASQANHASADHSNEEVARSFHWREFGAGRTDDFSRISAATTAFFTLDDGTTTMDGLNITAAVTNGQDTFFPPNTTDYFSITFVGTGLDIVRHESNTGAIDAYNVTIDGISIGSMDTTAVAGRNAVKKVVSGLPYGTHIARFQRAAVTAGPGFSRFLVYQPKKPTIPATAIELADYNVMANFVANATAGAETIATGVLRKNMAQREASYVNGTGGTSDWLVNSPAQRATTDRLNAYVETTFFGTGLEIRQQAQSNQSNNLVITLNGLAANTTNFPGLVSSAYGTGVAFNAATGIGDFLDAASTAGAGIRISGLPLARYTVRLLNGTGGQATRSEYLDFIVPTHSYSSDAFSLQNTRMIGSQSLSDNRKTSPVRSDNKVLGRAFAVGTIASASTSSTAPVPIPDMSVTVATTGNPLKISLVVNTNHSLASGAQFVYLYLNGASIVFSVQNESSAGNNIQHSLTATIPVPAGNHIVQGYWTVGAGTITAQNGTSRYIEAIELES